MLFMSMGAIILPRQFHVMVIEKLQRAAHQHSHVAFPTVSIPDQPVHHAHSLEWNHDDRWHEQRDFTLSVPLLTGHSTIAMLAYLRVVGQSSRHGHGRIRDHLNHAAPRHIFMPVIVRFTPRTWFPDLLL